MLVVLGLFGGIVVIGATLAFLKDRKHASGSAYTKLNIR
jgi:hypothetical protein